MKEPKLQFEDSVDWYIGKQVIDNTTLTEFRDKPFWCFNKGNKIDCCFNHMVGLPVKKKQEMPIFDYELEIFDAIENNQHLWCKKARGIGFTTFMTRYLAWKCLKDDELAGQNIFITTGTEAGFAKELKDKIHALFDRNYARLKIELKYNELILNKTRFKAFPTRNLKDMRGYTDVAYIFVDEADFFEKTQQDEIGAVIRSYEEKSDCKVIMVSTPYKPEGLFHQIENDEAFKGFFKKLILLYERGLDRIFDRQQIARIKKDNPDFEREYNGKYIGKIGNVFSEEQIKFCAEQGDSLVDYEINQHTGHPVGVDFGFNVSKSVICVGEWEPELQLLRIVEMWDNHGKPTTPSQVAEKMWEIYQRYGSNTDFFVDGANRGAVNEAKVRFGESITWDKKELLKGNRIHPINFGTEHKEMLRNMYIMVANGILAIPSKYEKLLLSMRTAQAEDWDLDKDNTINNDHLDGARLMCKGIDYKAEVE